MTFLRVTVSTTSAKCQPIRIAVPTIKGKSRYGHTGLVSVGRVGRQYFVSLLFLQSSYLVFALHFVHLIPVIWSLLIAPWYPVIWSLLYASWYLVIWSLLSVMIQLFSPSPVIWSFTLCFPYSHPVIWSPFQCTLLYLAMFSYFMSSSFYT